MSQENTHIEEQQLSKGLQNRHVQLIAIGGTIGTGLFMGAGNSIHFAGPGILAVYAIIGAMMFIMMRAMGEMLYQDPSQPTFIAYMTKYLGNRVGFFARWSYWLTMIFFGMAELTAIGKYVQFWFPSMPEWLIQIIFLVALTGVNLIAVALFGEMEFWFSMIKVIAILALIVTGLMMAFGHFQTPVGTVSFGNVFNHFSLVPNGWGNFINSFQMVMFAFVGMEFIGMTVAETKDPRKILPKAINQIPFRVLFFYLGALFVIMTIYPWKQIPAHQSPFVMVFELVGLKGAAAIINFVVLTAAASSFNSILFSTSRNFYSLAKESRAKFLQPFTKLSSRGLPAKALLFSSLISVSSAVISSIPAINDAFVFVTSAATDLFLMIYIMILWAYWEYRKSSSYMPNGFLLKAPKFFVPLAVIFFVFVYVTLFFNDSSVVPAIGATVWLVVFGIVSYFQPKKAVSEE
ncbi:amino acid permease [Fructobacillus fructosus]|uniref:L-asparagine transporter or related permease (AnsP) n=1 Tax=Fructobacillus fructosus TaxID=1631 RepID=A0ABN9YM35_9LACO|nr:amino acid permease [Fructobacillus fructosus]MBD9364424.1 amino acid permease [Leuconostoc mesenteroides]KRN53310.1 amino acid permease [Fructobacillus fructosus KCTC 3544]MBC9118203.1 amino acid permease [Fructobacillus fructosus]CAK1224318.1 L-asparagine transporter or related permease (AnsP) [Fructobacillus fructosus]CAK1225846.1 L-asparagine transporter or related permease (AnsP) [Fructobacillus fructosus]